MLIAIDHGNKNCKTGNKVFPSSLTESATRPPFGEDILQYNGKYYTLSDKRIPYLPDKTADNRFYVLTLFAVAYEIEAAGMYRPGEILEVQLAVGLPPAYYGRLYKQFEQYFTRGGVEEFTFRGKAFRVHISEAVAFPQAFAAAMTVYSSIRDAPKAIVLDIGGWTADYIQISSGNCDLSVCDSLENGVIQLYNRVKSKVSSDLDLLLDENDIDVILHGNNPEYGEAVCKIVNETAQSFVNDLFLTMRERMIDLRLGKTIFVGGGRRVAADKWLRSR
jgi:plasmid segregation protein ParM